MSWLLVWGDCWSWRWQSTHWLALSSMWHPLLSVIICTTLYYNQTVGRTFPSSVIYNLNTSPCQSIVVASFSTSIANLHLDNIYLDFVLIIYSTCTLYCPFTFILKSLSHLWWLRSLFVSLPLIASSYVHVYLATTSLNATWPHFTPFHQQLPASTPSLKSTLKLWSHCLIYQTQK